eukprot:GEMP01107958.1.p1 GENE.GEMP01107958.1~~GEMP01107958.1.p1  ORF type:complete len:108 (-),score=6.15 GEMP01107958.1:51-374(-)
MPDIFVTFAGATLIRVGGGTGAPVADTRPCTPHQTNNDRKNINTHFRAGCHTQNEKRQTKNNLFLVGNARPPSVIIDRVASPYPYPYWLETHTIFREFHRMGRGEVN